MYMNLNMYVAINVITINKYLFWPIAKHDFGYDISTVGDEKRSQTTNSSIL